MHLCAVPPKLRDAAGLLQPQLRQIRVIFRKHTQVPSAPSIGRRHSERQGVGAHLKRQPTAKSLLARRAARNTMDKTESTALLASSRSGGSSCLVVVTAAAAAIAIFCSEVDFSFLVTWLSSEVIRRGGTSYSASWIFSAHAVGLIACSPAAPSLVRWAGRGVAFIASLVFRSVVALLLGIVASHLKGAAFVVFIGCVRILSGCAAAVLEVASMAIVIRVAPEPTLPIVIGVLEGVRGLGMMLGPSIGALAFSVGGLVACTTTSAALLAAVALCAQAASCTCGPRAIGCECPSACAREASTETKAATADGMAPPPPSSSTSSAAMADRDGILSVWALLKLHGAQIALCVHMLAFLCVAGLQSRAEFIYGAPPYSLDQKAIGLLVLSTVLSFVVAAASSGLMERHIGLIALVASGLGIAACGLLLAGPAPIRVLLPQTVGVIWAGNCIFGLGCGLSLSQSAVLVVRAAACQANASASSVSEATPALLVCFGSIGQLLGPLAYGGLVELAGSQVTATLAATVLVLLAAVLVCTRAAFAVVKVD